MRLYVETTLFKHSYLKTAVDCLLIVERVKGFAVR